MEFAHGNIEKLLVGRLGESQDFRDAVSIVRDNSEGNIFLVGGTVSRTLVSEIYGERRQGQDFDFVVDVLHEDLKVPDGWEVTNHKFGNPTFKKGGIEVDVFPLSDQRHIKDNELEPTIENFLEGVPFSIQALVFDVKRERLIGEDGIRALMDRKFEVHNVESAKDIAKRKGVSIDEVMMRKAVSMGFEVVLFG